MLTNLVGIAYTFHVATVNVMVQRFLDQILWFISGQRKHSGLVVHKLCKEEHLKESLHTYLASKKINFKSRLDRNMNMFWYILISVMALGGSEWPTATRPKF